LKRDFAHDASNIDGVIKFGTRFEEFLEIGSMLQAKTLRSHAIVFDNRLENILLQLQTENAL
jgi:predicted phage-related endonuclease